MFFRHHGGNQMMVAGLAATTLSLLLATSLYKTSNCVSLGEEAEGGEAGTAAGAAPPPNTTAQGTGEAGEAAGEAGEAPARDAGGGEDAEEDPEPLPTEPLEHVLIDLKLPSLPPLECFQRLFLGSSPFVARFKAQGGGSAFVQPHWRTTRAAESAGNGGGGARQLTFVQAVNSRLSPVAETRVTEAQRYCYCSGSGSTSAVVVLETAVHTIDVPFSDFFHTYMRWAFLEGGGGGSGGGCRLLVTCELRWVKTTWLRAAIEANVLSESRSKHADAIPLIREVLATTAARSDRRISVVQLQQQGEEEQQASSVPPASDPPHATATAPVAAPVINDAAAPAAAGGASRSPRQWSSPPSSIGLRATKYAASSAGWAVALLLLMLHVWTLLTSGGGGAWRRPQQSESPLASSLFSGGSFELSQQQYDFFLNRRYYHQESQKLPGGSVAAFNAHPLTDLNIVTSHMSALRAQAALLANAQQRLEDDMHALELLLQDQKLQQEGGLPPGACKPHAGETWVDAEDAAGWDKPADS
jgi:hypothetical protein